MTVSWTCLGQAREPHEDVMMENWEEIRKCAGGSWDIPIPAEPNVAQPTALLLPMLGFDAAGYRLAMAAGIATARCQP